MSKEYSKINGVTEVGSRRKEKPKLVQINRIDLSDLFKGIKGASASDRSVLNISNYLDSLENTNAKRYEEELTIYTYRIISAKTDDDLADANNKDSLYTMINDKLSIILSNVKDLTRHKNYQIYDSVPVMVTAAKDIIRRFIKLALDKYSEEELYNISEDIITETDPLDYVKINGLDLKELEDETLKEFIRSIFKSCLSFKLDEPVDHLCFDCAYPYNECPKMRDIIKKNIADYDFIVDGYQKVHVEKIHIPGDPPEEKHAVEVTDVLEVTRCKKYFKANPGPKRRILDDKKKA